MSTSLGIGVIGLGFMGSTHLKAWRNVNRSKVVAVQSHDEKKLTGDLSGIQGNIGGPGEKFDFSELGRYTEVSELLHDTRVQAVDICLPTHLHAPVAIEALRAGKHVLVEKPMALTEKDAAEMIAESKQSGKMLMAGQVLRFVPAYSLLIGAVRNGTYGQMRSLVLRRRCAAPFWSQWMGDPSMSGGGVFDLLIHDLDFAICLFGYPQGLTASGYEDLPGGIDTLHAGLSYKNGPAVLVTGGWHHRKSYPFSMEYTAVFDSATVEYSSAVRDGEVNVYGVDGDVRKADLAQTELFEAELQYFTDCCVDGKQPDLCLPEESAAAVKLGQELLRIRRG